MSPSSYPRSSDVRGSGLVDSIKGHAITLFGILALMWGLEIADQFLPFLNLDQFGIRPRNTDSLIGIAAAPLLHGDFAHLIANSVPFLILGGIVMLGGRKVFWGVTIFVVIAGGLGVWLFGATNSVHIGASGLVFGYLGFILSRGFFERSIFWILVSFLILVLYGGLVMGVLPGQRGISWQSHLFGFGAGIVAAWLMFPRDHRLYQKRTKELEDRVPDRMKITRRNFFAGTAAAGFSGCTSSDRLTDVGFGADGSVSSVSRGSGSDRSSRGGGRAWAKREFQDKFLASGASLRYAARGGQGRAWTDSLQRGYDSFKLDARVGYAVKNLRTGRYLAAHNADEQKFGGSMPKPAVAATLLEKRKGDLTREEFQHIVNVCDKSINASWKALLTRFDHADEQAFERKYGLPDIGIRANTQSPRFYAEFFERCVNYKIDYGCELLLEAMRTSQYGRGRWYLPGSITYCGGKTGTSGAFKHEGLFFTYRGTPCAIVVYTKGHFGRGENIWKMGALFGGLFREYVA